MSKFVDGETVIAIAQTWAGTPYRHQGSLKGVGCDCLGLVRGIWRELYGGEPESLKPYSMDWAEVSNGDPLLEAARRHFLIETKLVPGTLMLFRWKPDAPAKHCGIYLGADRFLHAYERHSVMASPLVPHWRRKITGLFRFPSKLTGD
jgi:NlpC/P60 family putative phage cell wall peptidase